MFLEYRTSVRAIQKKETILFIGNIKKHKGLDYLLDAFYQVKNQGLPHQLVIIGSKDNFRTSDNTILRKIEKIGNDAVSFTGFVSGEKLMEYLATAALLVQPSLYEGFCLPPLEAMVLGTRALISDIPVLKEIYADYPVTFFRAGDCADLKGKMLELLLKKEKSSPVLSNELLSKYTFEKTASRIMKEIQ
jgi:glycosyltransferase involved in cell wall biosynthesis